MFLIVLYTGDISLKMTHIPPFYLIEEPPPPGGVVEWKNPNVEIVYAS